MSNSSCLLMCTAIVFFAACNGSAPAPKSAETLYVDLGCAKCHGEDRSGQRSGPAIVALAGRWQEETLVEYLKDPGEFVKENPRLAYIAEQYAISMPAYGQTPDADLQKLAQLLLGDENTD